ncbi:hypothetical protein K7432_016669 [Basidiobolus ranarum]|uniref:R3H domain-containing protein 2 n=1 Tax=Basidiobolus ranarum TaxID=34480 RepID=A0ABR2WEE1_9FUNG
MGPSTMINNSNDDQVRNTSISPQIFTEEIPESIPQDKNPLLQEGKKMILLKRPEQSKDLVEKNVLDSQNTEETSSTELDENELDDSEVPANNELDGFLLAALKSPKDRLLLLKLDQEMERFINDSSRNRLEFPQMNAYQRLIVHRVAQYFKLSHVVDSSKKAVILYKSPETEIPILRFMDLLEQEEEPAPQSLKIMRRADNSQSNQRKGFNDGSGSGSDVDKRLMSIEEREAAYQRARARIFQDSEDKKPTIPINSEVANEVPALEQVDSQQSPSQSDSESNKSRSSNTNKAGSGTYVKGVKNNSIRGNNMGTKSNSPRPGNQNTRYTRNTNH